MEWRQTLTLFIVVNLIEMFVVFIIVGVGGSGSGGGRRKKSSFHNFQEGRISESRRVRSNEFRITNGQLGEIFDGLMKVRKGSERGVRAAGAKIRIWFDEWMVGG